jgi:tetratricopeptide (TPR) repeat protein
LATWRKDELADPGGAEDAFVHALSLDPENLEVVRAIEALHRSPGREKDRIATLRLRAELEVDVAVKKVLLREAAELARGLGDAAVAEAVLRDVLREDDGDAWALAELTRLCEDAGAFAKVAALYLRRADLSDDAAERSRLRHAAANVLASRLGDAARAIDLYTELLDANVHDRPAAARLRALYERGGMFDDLARLLVRLVDAAPTAEARAVIRLDLARVQVDRLGSPRDAVDTLRAILREAPEQVEAAMDLGRILETGTREPAQALEAYEAALRGEPDHREALEAVARLAETTRAWDRAAPALAKLAELGEGEARITVALRLADVRELLGDDRGAAIALRLALTVDPARKPIRDRLRALLDSRKAWAELAALLVEDAALPGSTPTELARILRRAARLHMEERGTPSDAVPLLERAAELTPQDRDLLLSLCDAYAGASREHDATVVLERIISSFGATRTRELSVYHHRLGTAYARLGLATRALTELDRAFRNDPQNVTVLRDLGLLALEAGDLERAQKTFRALLLHKLDDGVGITKGQVFMRLGEISLVQNDRVKATQMLERAIENEPALARARELLDTLRD